MGDNGLIIASEWNKYLVLYFLAQENGVVPADKRHLSWQIALVYVGTVIGAGFASGQEILIFFASFGIKGLAGTAVAGVLFAYLGGRILRVAGEKGIENYKQLTVYLFGTCWGKIFYGIIDIFLLCGLSIMLVASSSLVEEYFGLTAEAGFIATGLFVYAALLLDVEGILWLNTLLVPGMIIMCAGTAATSIYLAWRHPAPDTIAGIPPGGHWLLAALLYVSYNLILGSAILVSLGQKAGKGGSTAAALAGGILGMLAAVICCALIIQGESVSRAELPMLNLAANIHPAAAWGYTIILWTAIITSALSNSFVLLKRMAGRLSWPQPVLAMLIFIPAFALIGWPFSRAVAVVYPLLGYCGLLFIAALIIKK